MSLVLNLSLDSEQPCQDACWVGKTICHGRNAAEYIDICMCLDKRVAACSFRILLSSITGKRSRVPPFLTWLFALHYMLHSQSP